MDSLLRTPSPSHSSVTPAQLSLASLKVQESKLKNTLSLHKIARHSGEVVFGSPEFFEHLRDAEPPENSPSFWSPDSNQRIALSISPVTTEVGESTGTEVVFGSPEFFEHLRDAEPPNSPNLWSEESTGTGKDESMVPLELPVRDLRSSRRRNNDNRTDGVTVDLVKNLHSSLKSCPDENEKEPTPPCLTVSLLPHQERALKWLLWRESQIPAGGILADDMGLGKTLTMISLVVRQKELDPVPTGSSDVWLSKKVKIKRSTGTLIVCPASVVGQWENEIKRRCKPNTLSILVFHGPDRKKYNSKLHEFDVVITTYQIVSREIPVSKTDSDSNPIGDYNGEREIRQSILLQIAFDRIILDEAHVIRNPKSGVSQSVCRLRAVRRWAVTGTPVQNKELDMYSLLRFLRVSPFDQLAVWKRWIDSSKAQGADQAADRLQLLIKTLLLRRRKDQTTGGSDVPLVSLPSRQVYTHNIQLSKEENKIYQQLLALSRQVLQEYIKNTEKKIGNQFSCDQSALSDTPAADKNQVLVLLLRLRQVCSHPALIKTMLDANDAKMLGSENVKDDVDLTSKMSTMTLGGNLSDEFFTNENNLFDKETVSSKMKLIMSEVKKVLSRREKAVIVSQWPLMLQLFAQHFRKWKIRCHMITGKVPIEKRTDIVEDFNTNQNGNPVMLISLGAGGVGLNLIGANHLFVADMHWNPQLEAQACDRVYRVGQKKEVYVHRFLIKGTIEEKILQIQESKFKKSDNILTGKAKLASKGLSLAELKMIFNFPQISP